MHSNIINARPSHAWSLRRRACGVSHLNLLVVMLVVDSVVTVNHALQPDSDISTVAEHWAPTRVLLRTAFILGFVKVDSHLVLPILLVEALAIVAFGRREILLRNMTLCLVVSGMAFRIIVRGPRANP